MHQSKCWPQTTNTGKPVSTNNIYINILICRLQLGIKRDKAAQNLISVFRPGMIRLLSHVKQSGNLGNLDMDQLLSDMQATMIEYLLYDYKIGDRGRATPYLFDPYQGFLTKWVKWIVGKHRKFYAHHDLYGNTSGDETNGDDESYSDNEIGTTSDGNSWSSIFEQSTTVADDTVDKTLMNEIYAIIDDGVTLNSNEYRVMTFCMYNANESNNTRHIDGLHITLASLMGVSRPRITRLYKRSRDKLLKRHGQLHVKENQ
jgi:hypothetical protein